MSEHHIFYQNTVWQYLLQMLKYVFPFILIPYLTRVLEPSGYAVYAYVLSFMTVVQTVAEFGFNLLGTNQVVNSKNDIEKVSIIVGTITLARSMLLVTLLLFVMVVSLFIPIMSENYAYSICAYLAVALNALLPDYVFQGYEKMGPLTTRYFLTKGLNVILTILFVHSIEDLIAVQLSSVLCALIAVVWSFVTIRKLFGVGISIESVLDSVHALGVSAIYCVSNVSSALFSGFATLLIGLVISDQAQISYWSLAMTTVQAVQALYLPITNSLYPHMLNNRDFCFAKKLALLALPALLIGTLTYISLAKDIVLILGGEQYLPGADVLVWISPLLPISFYAMFIGWPLLGALGRVKELTFSTLLSGATNILLLLIISTAGCLSLASVCTVRCFVELVLLLIRMYYLFKCLRVGRCYE